MRDKLDELPHRRLPAWRRQRLHDLSNPPYHTAYPNQHITKLGQKYGKPYNEANGDWNRPDALTQAELEKKRHERILNRFEEYLAAAKAGLMLEEVCLEALLAGFTTCYKARRFEDNLAVRKKLDKVCSKKAPTCTISLTLLRLKKKPKPGGDPC